MTAATSNVRVDDSLYSETRLAALDRYDVLDSPREEAFDRVTNLMRLILKTDVAIVSLIDAHRQWYKAVSGSDLRQVPATDSFCQVTIRSGTPVVVADARLDARFRDNEHVKGGLGVRAYVSVPLLTPTGEVIGTLCGYSHAPRDFSADQVLILEELARVTMSEMELRRLATRDPLTGIKTRRAFKDEATSYVAHARRHRTRLCSIALDIDHFKAINDLYGHAAGDHVLKGVTAAIAGQLRQSDLFARLGGEEFAVLLPETDVSAALGVAEKLRTAIAALRFPGSHPPMSVNASFGVAPFNPDLDDLDRLLVKADEALYDAKRGGRNRSAAWQGSTTSTNRIVSRRRVLKAGQLVFNRRQSVINCTVRALWETGADVDVSSTADIPDELTFEIKSDRTSTKSKVVARRMQSLELAFS